MSLYPSLEDMKLDHLIQAQNKVFNAITPNEVQINPSAPPNSTLSLYPSLGNYMGLELTEDVIAANMPEYTVAVREVN